MKLEIVDRILLTEIFMGIQGNLVQMGALKKVVDMTNFTAEELDDFNIIQLPNGQIRWDTKEGVDPIIEIPYSEKQEKMIAQFLRSNDKLNAKHFGLLEKFGVKLPEEEVS